MISAEGRAGLSTKLRNRASTIRLLAWPSPYGKTGRAIRLYFTGFRLSSASELKTASREVPTISTTPEATASVLNGGNDIAIAQRFDKFDAWVV